MDVRELKLLLQDVPNNMEVVILLSETVLGEFQFGGACVGESGVIKVYQGEGASDPKEVFCLLPHNFTTDHQQKSKDERQLN